MNSQLATAYRKLQTASAVIRHCRNWPQLLSSRTGISHRPALVQFRNGLQLKPSKSIDAGWPQFFEAAIADVYGIRSASPDLVIDVGANIGAFTCLAAHTHHTAQIYAFEPQANIIRVLNDNIALNGLTNVQVEQAPVTKDARIVQFSTQSTDGGSGIYLLEQGTISSIQSVTLDNIPFQSFSSVFFKLDCEGAEGELIEWIVEHRTILPRQVQVACEYHPWCPLPVGKAMELLQGLGFVAEQSCEYGEVYLFATTSA